MIGRNLKTALIVSCALVFLASCGYHFSGEGEGPKPGLRCIAIPVFENKTTEPNLGEIFATDLSREFMQKGNMRVVPVEEAEAVFKGVILSIFVFPVAHHPTNIVTNQIAVVNRLYLTIDIRCEDKITHKVLWRDPAFSYYKVYQINTDPLHPDPVLGYENRQAALRYLASEMSQRIHDRFLSNF